jgi:hypothetical protein
LFDGETRGPFPQEPARNFASEPPKIRAYHE